MHSVSLHCLGVGDGTASTGRNHSAYLYDLGQVRVLIDCGEPVGRSLKLSGLPPDAVDVIFLSHLHSDHIGGFAMLVQGLWLDDRKKALPIYLPADGIEPIKTILRTSYLVDEILPFRMDFRPLAARNPVELGSGQEAVRITPFRTTHLDRARKNFQAKYPGEYAAYSFLIEAGDRRVAHSADIGAPQDLEPLLAKPIDLLVCELAHFEPQDLFTYLRGRDIKRIVLTHVARYDWDQRFDKLRSTAERELAGMNVSFAKDGEVIEL